MYVKIPRAALRLISWVYRYTHCQMHNTHTTYRLCIERLMPSALTCCTQEQQLLNMCHQALSTQRRLVVLAGYSIWTNTNYKNPLIASAVACLLGNVCYCLSYDLGAVWLLFLARLITGFGEIYNPAALSGYQHAISLRLCRKYLRCMHQSLAVTGHTMGTT